MAKNSSVRLPHFGKVLFLALVISLGISVWSVQNAPTQTQQYASVEPEDPYCSSFNTRDCIYGCTPTSTGGTCKPAPTPTPVPMTAPTNLIGTLKNCVKTSFGTTKGTLSLSWSKVTNATSYKISVYNSVQRISLTSTTTSLSTSSYSYATGYKLYWYVAGYNSNSKTTGSKSGTQEIKCQ